MPSLSNPSKSAISEALAQSLQKEIEERLGAKERAMASVDCTGVGLDAWPMVGK